MAETQIATDEKIVSDGISYRGYREVHVMRYGQPANELAWAQAWAAAKCPDFAQEFLTYYVRPDVNEKLNYWHLTLWWNAREVVEFSKNFPNYVLKYGVLWWIGEGETVSFAVDCAATLYQQKFGRMPSTAWVRVLPKGAKEVIELGVGEHRSPLRLAQAPIKLGQGDWVPERFVVVGCPLEEWAPVWKGGRYE